jgi:natural product biosynthesis luciferase-like monooxygenase protein
MRFGLYTLNTYAAETDGDGGRLYGRVMEQIDAAEALDFDAYWCTEHHFQYFGGMIPNPQLVLAAAASRAKRLRLGTAVSLLALHDPLRIAEDFAVLDCLSGGRVEFGAGRGMYEEDYRFFGKDWSNAQDRLKEALQLVRRAWTTDPLEWQGEHYRVAPVTVLPRPLQRPHPRMWFTASRDPASFRWAGENGLHLLTVPWIIPLEVSRDLIAQYRQAWAGSGRPPDEARVFSMFPIHVSDSPPQARREAEPAWHIWRDYSIAKSPGNTPEQRLAQAQLRDYDFVRREGRAIIGTPDECVTLLQGALDLVQPTDVGLCFHFGSLTQPAVLHSMELFAREVRPHLGVLEAV